MQKQLEQVSQFQRAFRQNVSTQPTLLSDSLAQLRYDLAQEELDEYLEGVRNNDIVEITDSLTDQLYILCGTILEHGLQNIIEKCFTEVQRSNMSKLDDVGLPIINGENGVFDETRPLGKVLKSYNYSEPDLKQFFIEK